MMSEEEYKKWLEFQEKRSPEGKSILQDAWDDVIKARDNYIKYIEERNIRDGFIMTKIPIDKKDIGNWTNIPKTKIKQKYINWKIKRKIKRFNI